ncbi:MAG: 5'-nucleotidase SurE [Phycisphaerae bacterium]
MHVLLTNDDGYDAPGLRALYEAVSGLAGASIEVIAPSEAQSGKGHVVSDRFRLRAAEAEGIGPLTVVEGSPADCVRAAVGLPGRRRPDWVLSGINRGSNLGIDIYNSGTVAAAREAGFYGIRAIALSQYTRGGAPVEWLRSTRTAAAVIAAIIMPDAPCPPHAPPRDHALIAEALRRSPPAMSRGWWNVNLPIPDGDQPTRGAMLTRISRDPYHLDYRVVREADGSESCENVASYHDRPAAPGTDVAAVFEGWISISPLKWCDESAF